MIRHSPRLGAGAAGGIKKGFFSSQLRTHSAPERLGHGESIASSWGCLQSPVAGILFISL